jgi:hypothetical protein
MKKACLVVWDIIKSLSLLAVLIMVGSIFGSMVGIDIKPTWNHLSYMVGLQLIGGAIFVILLNGTLNKKIGQFTDILNRCEERLEKEATLLKKLDQDRCSNAGCPSNQNYQHN